MDKSMGRADEGIHCWKMPLMGHRRHQKPTVTVSVCVVMRLVRPAVITMYGAAFLQMCMRKQSVLPSEVRTKALMAVDGLLCWRHHCMTRYYPVPPLRIPLEETGLWPRVLTRWIPLMTHLDLHNGLSSRPQISCRPSLSQLLRNYFLPQPLLAATSTHPGCIGQL